MVGLLADERLACGQAAGLWMYGGKREFIIIPNGVDTAAYRFMPQVRTKVRNELGLADDTLAIGHVGSLSTTKNQSFLIKLVKRLKDEGNSQARLILIGDGPMRAELAAEAERLGLTESVMFLGIRQDVSRLMMAMDVFCMPSLFEGFPIVAVEAQATGLPVIISSTVSREVCITNLVRQLPIDKGLAEWVEEISRLRVSTTDRWQYADIVRTAGFDIRHSAKMLETIYRRNDKSINVEHGTDDIRRYRNDDS